MFMLSCAHWHAGLLIWLSHFCGSFKPDGCGKLHAVVGWYLWTTAGLVLTVIQTVPLMFDSRVHTLIWTEGALKYLAVVVWRYHMLNCTESIIARLPLIICQDIASTFSDEPHHWQVKFISHFITVDCGAKKLRSWSLIWQVTLTFLLNKHIIHIKRGIS